MNSLKKSMHWAKVLTFAFALSCLMFFFPTTAMAASCGPTPGTIFKQIPVNQGSFDYSVNNQVRSPVVVRSVNVCLEPPTATGKIDMITIIGPDGIPEFGCRPEAVNQGTNLIRACGGPAVLKPGDTIYMAQGSGFTPDRVRLTVNLSPDFEP